MSDIPEVVAATKPASKWLPRPRFSLRSLLLATLLIGSATTLWWRWEPWVVEHEFSPTGDSCQIIPSQLIGKRFLPVWANGSTYIYDLSDGSLR